MLRTYSGLGDEQANRREGKVRDIEAILMDRDITGIRRWEVRVGVYTRREAEGRREATDGEGDRMGNRTGSSVWS